MKNRRSKRILPAAVEVTATPTLVELVARADDLRQAATALLESGGLLGIVESVGPARVVGGYTLDLMTRPDIDLSLRLPDARDVASFFALGRSIACRFEVMRMQFENAYLHPFKEGNVVLDRGLYWGIRLLHSEHQLNVDIWGYGEAEYSARVARFDELAAALAKVDRGTILKIKDAACRLPRFGTDMTSWQVYEAIIRNGVRSVAGFEEWMAVRSHGSEWTGEQP